jgi:hypothetical protein
MQDGPGRSPCPSTTRSCMPSPAGSGDEVDAVEPFGAEGATDEVALQHQQRPEPACPVTGKSARQYRADLHGPGSMANDQDSGCHRSRPVSTSGVNLASQFGPIAGSCGAWSPGQLTSDERRRGPSAVASTPNGPSSMATGRLACHRTLPPLRIGRASSEQQSRPATYGSRAKRSSRVASATTNGARVRST